MKKQTLAAITLIALIFCGSNSLLGIRVKLLKVQNFSEYSERPNSPFSFIVTDGDVPVTIVPDANGIQFYEENGTELEWFQTISTPGNSSEVFGKLTHIFIDQENKRFGVLEKKSTVWRLYLYKIDGPATYTLEKIVPLRYGAHDFFLRGSTLYISGYEEDELNRYSFFSIDLGTQEGLNQVKLEQPKKKFLLNSGDIYLMNRSYGFDKDFSQRYIGAMGNQVYFTMHNDDAICLWQGAMRIVKFNVLEENPQKIVLRESKSMKNYIQPFPSQELIYAHTSRNFQGVKKAKTKMSIIRDVISTSKYYMVIYEGPTMGEWKQSPFWIRVYSHLENKFIEEVRIPGNPSNKFYFQASDNILYSLSNRSRDGVYRLYKYRVNEAD